MRKRLPCPHCGKRGMGRIRVWSAQQPLRWCRYCKRYGVTTASLEEIHEAILGREPDKPLPPLRRK